MIDLSNLPVAKKSLGQNFLQDKNIAKKIVESINPNENDFVVEIGPGPGALTHLLTKISLKKLFLIEKDLDLAKRHAKFFSVEVSSSFKESLKSIKGKQNIFVLEADALKISWQDFDFSWKCIGNLPYNVASPLMWDIFSQSRGLIKASFMVQKEVGQRLAAKPNSSAYGALSVWVQSFVQPVLEFTVPPQVFTPRPKVHSAVVSFTPVDNPPADKKIKNLSELLKICFQQRRKQLGTILRHHDEYRDRLTILGIAPQARPETLSPKQFQELAGCSNRTQK